MGEPAGRTCPDGAVATRPGPASSSTSRLGIGAAQRRGSASGCARLQPDDPRLTKLASAIARYCEAHPHAADTVEGVWRWWLGDAHLGCAMEDVARAMAALVRAGTVAERQLPDGRIVYSPARQEG